MHFTDTRTSTRIQALNADVPRQRGLPRRDAPRGTRILALAGLASALVSACGSHSDDSQAKPAEPAEQAALVVQGTQIFRNDTLGDETQWIDAPRMHEVIRTAVDPTTALSVGLKVDAEALPAAVAAGIQNGSVDLRSPATTVTLLKLNAVVGLKGTVETVNGVDVLTRVGVTCALCHSTVDDSFAPGIGKRLDGWPNRDLNPGAIIALSPAVSAAAKAVYDSWGPGKYDPPFNLDGKNGRPVIPPAYGMVGTNKITSTGDGKVVFKSAGKCVTCHSGPEFTDASTRLHPPSDAAGEPEPGDALRYASRSAT